MIPQMAWRPRSEDMTGIYDRVEVISVVTGTLLVFHSPCIRHSIFLSSRRKVIRLKLGDDGWF